MDRDDALDTERFSIDKARVRAAFDHSAPKYDEVAVLQHEVGRRLLDRLELIRLEPSMVLDVGAGTGRLSAALGRCYGSARVISLDLSARMLQLARRRAGLFRRLSRRCGFVCADAENLPCADASVDLVVSNLVLQWCNDTDRALAEFRRVLRPGGLLMFTTFGPDTLRELRASWNGVDGRIHVNRFIDMHDLGDALLRVGLSEPVMDREDFTLTYPDVAGLMRDLKALGAHNSTHGRPRGLTGRGRLSRVAEAYERFRDNGRLPATYEVVYGHCWVTAESAPRHSRHGEVTVPLSRIQRARSG
ncbi:MAG: malonyl-ACP O-methyltransferase BioC [Gammaproteobacteria bacterium]|nr:malonyl-ACP O-methyltransferase BioC [Gammaproteobacteria bacterium]